ncbi:MAG TPA: DUF5057 domain-containing protein [Eubacterium sp.]|nr:DUF5057 domain-containing protein [Eubacterium sp.]
MSKLRKKIVVPISLTLTGCLVVAAFVLNDSLTKVDANVAFNGISDIVSSHGKDKPFNIVEVVPDKKMASIGYLIDGQEPDDWFGTLAQMSDTEGKGATNRAAYMKSLKEKLAPITTDKKDNTRPLYYEPYEESYVNQGNDWSELALVDMDRINQGTTGYKMTEQAEGDYKFNTDYQLSVNEEGLPTGHYRQNVDHYVFMQGEDETEDGSESVDTGKRGYYSVAFSAVKLPDGMTNTKYLVPADNSQKADGNTDSSTDSSTDNTTDTGTGDDTVEKHVVYSIKSAYAIVSAEGMQSIAKYDPKAYIYRTDNSDTTSPYKFVARADQMAAQPDTNKPDYEKYTYYTVEMEYVPADKITDDETYYEVDSNVPIEFNYDETGEYGAVLDTQNPYEKINTGDTSTTDSNDANEKIILHDTDGYFDIVKDSQTYTYMGKGNGDYIMVADKNGSLDYPVNTTRIYYKGGFKNNNWFRTGVFNQEGKTGDDDKTANMTFKVKTVTPKELEQIDVSTIDLLYLSGSKSILSKNLGDNDAKYNTGNDISWDKVKQIVQRVHQSGIMMPVIVDNGIVWPGSSADSSNIKKLAGLLSCNNFSSLNFTKDSADNFINWNDNKVITYYKVDSSTRTHGYVVGNEYVIPRNYYPDKDVPFVLRDDFASAFIENEDETQFVNAAKNENFDEIAEYINSENTSRKNENNTLGQEKYEYYDKKISKAIVLSYIISYSDKRDVAKPMDELNILDIEPGMNSQSDCITPLKKNLKSWLGANCPADDNIHITCVNSSEFIGRIEDLNNYDMIYMGLCCDNLNKSWENGAKITVYNDSSMNGLIYSNVGDIVVIDPTYIGDDENGSTYSRGHAGLLDSDYLTEYDNGLGLIRDFTDPNDNEKYVKAVNTYRGPGNDITTEKVEALNNYLKAGYPIVVDKDFYKNDNNIEKVNDYYIDNCSNIYGFMEANISNDHLIKTKSDNNLSTDLYTNLTAEKPQIKVKEQKKEQGKDYVKLEDNHIVLEFNINNRGGADANASFDIGFYLDSNADGKFSPTQEKIAGNNVQIYRDGTLVSPQIDENGEYNYNLEAGKYNYKLVYELPTQFVGVIPWQLRASQTTNSYRYDVTGGYFYKQADSNQKQHIKILQIDTSKGNNDKYLAGGTTFDMQDQKSKTNSEFSKLLKQVTDFELDITTLAGDSDKFKTLCKEDKVKDYDMLVIGFSDCYEIYNDSKQVDRIKEFIQSGKAVLFTHDTTSLSNNKYKGNETVRNNNWGYDFNTIVRDVVGMDRYGILHSSALKKGNTLKEGTDEYAEAVSYAKEHNTDIAYKPRSNKETIVRQNQGFAYGDLDSNQDTSHGGCRLYSWLYGTMGHTKNAEKVNSGQITTYPFKIPDKIDIAETHRQYYQLDFNEDSDNDGESDIVVWYTLSDQNVYYSSPKDVRNNYYIYTKGNVTYSGVGHSDVTQSVDELKLYINTMIAAYSVVDHAPAISLKEGYDTKSADISTIYSTIDTAIQQDEEAKEEGDPDAARLDVDDKGNIATQDVYFTVKDTNMLRNQVDKDTTVNMSFFIEGTKDDHDKEIDDDGNTIYLKEMKNWQIYSLHDDGSEADLLGPSEAGNNRTFFANNKTYKVKVPLATLPAGQNSIKVYAVASSNITVMQNNQEVKKNTPEAYKTFQIQRVGLADLD